MNSYCCVSRCIGKRSEGSSDCILHCNKNGLFEEYNEFCIELINHIAGYLYFDSNLKKVLKVDETDTGGELSYRRIDKYGYSDNDLDEGLEIDGEFYGDFNEFQFKLYPYFGVVEDENSYDTGFRIVNRVTPPDAFFDEIRSVEVQLTKIKFPFSSNEYIKVLHKLNNVSFRDCEITASLALMNQQVFFESCTFKHEWHLVNYMLLKNPSSSLYSKCIFEKQVIAKGDELNDLILAASQFSNCTFKSEVYFQYCYFEKPIFSAINLSKKIKMINIENCKVGGRFILSGYKGSRGYIENILLRKSLFEDKFELKSCDIGSLVVDDCNFEKVADLNGSICDSVYIRKCVFENFVGFESLQVKSKKAVFIHNTFNQVISFRDAKFFKGVDLGKCNYNSESNFLGITIDGPSTRETYRTIKNSYDLASNHIEANKFFKREMVEYRKDLAEESKNYFKRFLLWFNHKVSDFGQCYIRPLILFFLTTILFSVYTFIHDKFTISDIARLNYSLPIAVLDIINDWAKSVIPFNQFLVKGMEIESLFFGLLCSIFLWHAIVAIKRTSQR
ncbi:hypothetical protein GHNINEIG_01909 [Hydrogenovibrio crunogenus]|uniref:Uncharacterized protein n=1 Tax=Hydrogenovibrio crunogenus TaxID=39765 RepID=A0A4P7P3A7_9GAMM|nr:hypothetical protein [Hydrogenovibrio crunogenus]QBZ83842.1 hypothetical protein GHNINEIG_01909 [Hydrogenovibrio crunogenus]